MSSIFKQRFCILFIAAVVTLFMLGACNAPYNGGGEPLAKITYNHIDPMPIYVAAYEPVPYPKQVDLQGFVMNPADVVYSYLQNRFQAVGAQGKLRVSVHDVSLTHEVTESEGKVRAAIGVDRKDHYTVRIMVKVQSYGLDTYNDSEVVLTAHRNIFISEHVSIIEREALETEAMQELIEDLNTALRKILRDRFQVIH